MSEALKTRHVPRVAAADLTAGLLWIVVFGPGRGEAILVRLPDGGIGVVDGCREPGPRGDGNPVANLLRELNVPRLRFACLTHPHDDHYAGLGLLLERDFPGKVDQVWNVLSMTAHEKEAVLAWVERYYEATEPELVDMAGHKGLDRAMSALLGASRSTTAPARRQQLLAGRLLLHERDVCGARLEVEAWGPTDGDVDDALFEFFEKEPSGQDLRDILPNRMSGALLLEWGASRVLLAGDLLQRDEAHRGWSQARELVRRRGPVQVVNVAHHASKEAHDDVLWAAMSPRLAVVTPFRNAEMNGQKPKHPPRPRDILRMLKAGAEVAITSEPMWLSREQRYPRRSTPRSPGPPKSSAAGAVRSAFASASNGRPRNARDNAVAVALNSKGDILEVLLAGDADLYVAGS